MHYKIVVDREFVADKEFMIDTSFAPKMGFINFVMTNFQSTEMLYQNCC